MEGSADHATPACKGRIALTTTIIYPTYRLRAERKLREALHRWRQHVVRKGWQVEHFQRLQERKARDRLQGAMTTWMLGLSRKAKRELHRDNAGTKGRQGGKQEKIAQEGRQAAEGGTGASFASSPSAPRSRDSPRGPNSLLAEIEALSQEVSRAEQLLEEKERLMQKKATARVGLLFTRKTMVILFVACDSPCLLIAIIYSILLIASARSCITGHRGR